MHHRIYLHDVTSFFCLILCYLLFLFNFDTDEGKSHIRNARFWWLELSEPDLCSLSSLSTLFFTRHQQALLLLIKVVGKNCLFTKLCYITKKYNCFSNSLPLRLTMEAVTFLESVNGRFLSLLLSSVVMG